MDDFAIGLVEATTGLIGAFAEIPPGAWPYILAMFVFLIGYFIVVKILDYLGGNKYETLVGECRDTINKFNTNMGRQEGILDSLFKSGGR